MRAFLTFVAIFALAVPSHAALPVVTKVDAQPLAAQAKRLSDALVTVGAPLPKEQQAGLDKALAQSDDADLIAGVQAVLDPLCLIGVNINPESRVKVQAGPAKPILVQSGWTTFLIKVHNEAGVTAPLRAKSPNAKSHHGAEKEELRQLWMDLAMRNQQPLPKTLTGLEVEYRLISIYSRDAGKREGKLLFDVGQGTQDLGFRNEIDFTFNARKAHSILLNIVDENGKPTTAALEIRDEQGRVYPAQTKRTAPDFSFHPQIYRSDGEEITLPTGIYSIKFYRGPESIPEIRRVRLGPNSQALAFRVKRWIDPAKLGWWSGDHHIHAAGCAHYKSPTEGVHAPDMMKHILGEDLKIGCNLTWGPCFDYQKQFFTGEDDQVSRSPYILHYDVEVSGFGSHQSGHLCLLRLKEQIFPGGDSKDHWPTLGLNTLKWAKRQGAVVGPAHSGWGLAVPGTDLPNYNVPPYDGIGANEYIVDVTHFVPGPGVAPVPAVDFISMCDTPYVWELNMWYHTLNCGFRTRISGETDFPCIYGERVGLGRSYVKLRGTKPRFDSWCDGIQKGSAYVSDGRSHLMDFAINNLPVGERGGVLNLREPKKVSLSVKAAALLSTKPNPSIRDRPYDHKPYWHIERARLGDSREVEVEVIVNGQPVQKTKILADGTTHDLKLEVPIERSSWVAARILPSSHTNPVWVIIDNKPVRASKRSAEWCLKGVDVCWKQKERFIAPKEMDDAKKAYAHAKATYLGILAESEVD